MTRVAQIVLLIALAMHSVSAQATTSPSPDSITLIRTRCLGSCPAYVLKLHANGVVEYKSNGPRDAGRTESLTADAGTARRVERELARAGFYDLPRMWMGRDPYCRSAVTDVPTITITVARRDSTHSVSYYTGCMGSGSGGREARPYIDRLRTMADSIDVISGAKEWIR